MSSGVVATNWRNDRILEDAGNFRHNKYAYNRQKNTTIRGIDTTVVAPLTNPVPVRLRLEAGVETAAKMRATTVRENLDFTGANRPGPAPPPQNSVAINRIGDAAGVKCARRNLSANQVALALDLSGQKQQQKQIYDSSDEEIDRNQQQQQRLQLNIQPKPRCVGEESNLNYTRNRGTLRIETEPPPGEREAGFGSTTGFRCGSSRGHENQQRSRGQLGPHSTAAGGNDGGGGGGGRRIRDANAERIMADQEQASQMRQVLSREPAGQAAASTNTHTSEAPSRCPTELSRAMWQKDRGDAMAASLGRSNTVTTGEQPDPQQNDSKPAQRKICVGEVAQSMAALEGSGMRDVFGGGASQSQSHNQQQLTAGEGEEDSGGFRTKFEGRQVALKNRGVLAQQMGGGGGPHGSPGMDSDQPAVPRIKPEAQAVADAHLGKSTQNLFAKYGNLPGDPKPRPHVNRSSQNTYNRAKGAAAQNLVVPVRQRHSSAKPSRRRK